MTPSFPELLNMVLALPETERVTVADALLSSLPDETFDHNDDELEQELLRRSDELKDDPSASIAWSDIKILIARGELQ